MPKKWRSHPIRKRDKKYLKKNITLGIIFLILIFGVFIIGTLAWISRDLPNPERLSERNIAQTTKIYDRTGQTVLYEIYGGEKRTLVKLSEIPRTLVLATIVAEDKNFFKHQGFDLRAITRALIIDFLRGGKVQGGSTMTQQLVKNILLSPQKTYVRKIRELLLAYQIEKKFSKEQILQMYFNEIPYGSNAYGIEAACQLYFNKSVKDLTLDEAALITALPKAPTYYSPYGNHQDELIVRRNYILDSMVEEGYLTQEVADAAEKTDTLKKIKPKRENIIAPHFVMYIKELLTEKYGQRLVEQGGLKVITALDIDKQKIAETTIENWAEKNKQNFGATNAALVSIDVKTGQILAMVGSKDFYDESIDGQVNVALRPRQPGSSIKPIVYAEAFERGFTPETILFDAETNFGPGGAGQKDYIPKDYDGKFRGPVTMRQALAGSLNIPGVETLYLAGLDNVLNLAQIMGYTTLQNRDSYGLSLVLGGGEVELLEHTAAFGIFAREGKQIPTVSIVKVSDNNGKILQEDNPQLILPQEVITPQTCRLISNILSDNQARAYIFGQENWLNLGDRPVAAKTGTTNDFRDAWAVGYTPSLVTGVWVGNSRNEAMKKGADGATVAAPIWHEFMEKALANQPAENFNPPDPISVEKPILRGELPEEVILKIDKASGKLATDLTPASFIIEKTFKGYHSILHYVDKNNPQGPAPANPNIDPQYSRWEEGIRKWLKENSGGEGSLGLPPTEYDNLHIPANQPTASILSPKNGAAANEQLLKINIKAEAPRGVRRVVCSVDNIPLDETYTFPFQCTLNLAGLEIGEHKIKAAAFDDIDNSRSAEIWINLKEKFTGAIAWLSPKDKEIIWRENFPLTISILTPAAKIKDIKLFNQNLKTQETALLSTIFNPEVGGEIEFIWNNADSGNYKLWVETTDFNNETIISDKIEIEVR